MDWHKTTSQILIRTIKMDHLEPNRFTLEIFTLVELSMPETPDLSRQTGGSSRKTEKIARAMPYKALKQSFHTLSNVQRHTSLSLHSRGTTLQVFYAYTSLMKSISKSYRYTTLRKVYIMNNECELCRRLNYEY